MRANYRQCFFGRATTGLLFCRILNGLNRVSRPLFSTFVAIVRPTFFFHNLFFRMGLRYCFTGTLLRNSRTSARKCYSVKRAQLTRQVNLGYLACPIFNHCSCKTEAPPLARTFPNRGTYYIKKRKLTTYF